MKTDVYGEGETRAAKLLTGSGWCEQKKTNAVRSREKKEGCLSGYC